MSYLTRVWDGEEGAWYCHWSRGSGEDRRGGCDTVKIGL